VNGIPGKKGPRWIDGKTMSSQSCPSQYKVETHICPVGQRDFNVPAAPVNHQQCFDDKSFLLKATGILDFSLAQQRRNARNAFLTTKSIGHSKGHLRLLAFYYSDIFSTKRRGARASINFCLDGRNAQTGQSNALTPSDLSDCVLFTVGRFFSGHRRYSCIS